MYTVNNNNKDVIDKESQILYREKTVIQILKKYKKIKKSD